MKIIVITSKIPYIFKSKIYALILYNLIIIFAIETGHQYKPNL